MHTEVISTQDGVQSELRYFPLNNSAADVLLIFPAMGVAAKHYDALAEALNSAGLQAVVAELRGLGSSTVRAGKGRDFGYREIVELDFPAQLRAVRNAFSNNRVFLLGHSLGGQLACLMMAQQFSQPDTGEKLPKVDGLILSASCAIDFRGWAFPRNLFTLAFTQGSALIAQIFGYYPGHKLGFGGLAARRLILDWAQSARSGRYRLLGTDYDFESALQNVELPILSLNYQDDRFAPTTATQKLLDKMPNSTATMVLLDAQELDAKTADHFSWMRSPTPVAARVKRWLSSLPGE